MARPVLFSRDGLPVWLDAGRRWEQLHRDFGEVRAAQLLGFGAEQIRTISRWSRLASFLDRAFPTTAGGPVYAGSAVVLELERIFRRDAVAATALSAEVLAGQMNLEELRRRSAELRDQQPDAAAPDSRGVIGDRFRSHVHRLLWGDPFILRPLGFIGGIRVINRRTALQPDFVATFAAPQRQVALLTRSPAPTRSRSTIAAELFSDAAVLLVQFDGAILILPTEKESVARATLALWQQRAHAEFRRRRNFSLMLVEGRTYQHITDETESDG